MMKMIEYSDQKVLFYTGHSEVVLASTVQLSSIMRW